MRFSNFNAQLMVLLVVAVSPVFADSRDDFVQHILPIKYPQLVDYVRANGILPVLWISQTDEEQSLTVDLTVRESIMVTTMMYTGPAANMNTSTMVILIDRDLDSRLDFSLWLSQGDEPQISESPTDEASLVLWDTLLAIIMKYSDCCPK